jgi:hypothetical protein
MDFKIPEPDYPVAIAFENLCSPRIFCEASAIVLTAVQFDD